jgi:hypothetical protein
MRLYDADEGRGIKNVHSVRDVPLHPTCAGFAASVAARKGPEVFDYPAWKSGKVPAFQKRVNGFLRDAGALRKRRLQEIPTFGAALLADLAREIGMPQDISRAITGHRFGRDTQDAGYGVGRLLNSRAKWMAKVDPLN